MKIIVRAYLGWAGDRFRTRTHNFMIIGENSFLHKFVHNYDIWLCACDFGVYEINGFVNKELTFWGGFPHPMTWPDQNTPWVVGLTYQYTLTTFSV